MPYTDAVEDMRKERKRQKQNALNKLEEFTKNKIALKRPVFFVPGWTDESCACWRESNKINICIKDWFDKSDKTKWGHLIYDVLRKLPQHIIPILIPLVSNQIAYPYYQSQDYKHRNNIIVFPN